MSQPRFVPKTVYVTYIASASEKVWDALTSAERTKQYFFGRAIEIEHWVGGTFTLRLPDGRIDVKGRVMAWDPPGRLSVTWGVDFEEFRELPESLVTYDIEPMGESVKLTMTEAFQWDVPDAILGGGRQGWPLVQSSLKSLLETGKPIVVSVKMGPPKEMMEALKDACARKPWRDAGARR